MDLTGCCGVEAMGVMSACSKLFRGDPERLEEADEIT